jgi:hypothetical protein
VNPDLLLDAVRIGLSACVADRPRRHPDSSRQRKARLRSVERCRARALKGQYVPLCFVAPPSPPSYWNAPYDRFERRLAYMIGGRL